MEKIIMMFIASQVVMFVLIMAATIWAVNGENMNSIEIDDLVRRRA